MGSPDDVDGLRLDRGDRLQPDVDVLGVVAAPVEPFGPAEPLLLAAPPELALVRAQLEHGDLVGLGVGQKPFIGVQAVVLLREDRDGRVDRVAVLEGLANPGGEGLALGVELRLGDGGLGDDQAGVVEVIVHAALDAAGVCLHQDPMPLRGLDVEPDVEVADHRQVPHGDVAEDDRAVRGRGPDGGEGRAMLSLGGLGLAGCWLAERLPFEPVGAGLQGAVEEVGLDVGVDRDDVEQVEVSAVEGRPGGRGAVGGPFHFLQVLFIVSPEEQGVDERAGRSPAFAGRAGAPLGGQGLEVVGDLRRHQPAVLVAPLVGFTFDVQDDPAGLRVAVGRAIPADRGRVGPRHSCFARRHRPGRLRKTPMARTRRSGPVPGSPRVFDDRIGSWSAGSFPPNGRAGRRGPRAVKGRL